MHTPQDMILLIIVSDQASSEEGISFQNIQIGGDNRHSKVVGRCIDGEAGCNRHLTVGTTMNRHCPTLCTPVGLQKFVTSLYTDAWDCNRCT